MVSERADDLQTNDPVTNALNLHHFESILYGKEQHGTDQSSRRMSKVHYLL